jgi:hypothetical protein
MKNQAKKANKIYENNSLRQKDYESAMHSIDQSSFTFNLKPKTKTFLKIENLTKKSSIAEANTKLIERIKDKEKPNNSKKQLFQYSKKEESKKASHEQLKPEYSENYSNNRYDICPSCQTFQYDWVRLSYILFIMFFILPFLQTSRQIIGYRPLYLISFFSLLFSSSESPCNKTQYKKNNRLESNQLKNAAIESADIDKLSNLKQLKISGYDNFRIDLVDSRVDIMQKVNENSLSNKKKSLLKSGSKSQMHSYLHDASNINLIKSNDNFIEFSRNKLKSKTTINRTPQEKDNKIKEKENIKLSIVKPTKVFPITRNPSQVKSDSIVKTNLTNQGLFA